MKTRSVIFLLVVAAFLSFPQASAAQWELISGPEGGIVRILVASGEHLYAGTPENGVFLSTDRGASWKPINNGLPENVEVTCLAARGDYVLAGTGQGTVFLSGNRGRSWEKVFKGLPQKEYDNVSALSIFGNRVFASTHEGIYYLDIEEKYWKSANARLAYIHCFEMKGTNLFAGTTDGIFLSTDNGKTWSPVSQGLGDSPYINCLFADESAIYAGAGEVSWNSEPVIDREKGIFTSSDGGSRWTQANVGFPEYTAVLCLSAFGDALIAGTNRGIFKSSDNGRSWTAMNGGLPEGASVMSLAVIDDRIFAGVSRVEGEGLGEVVAKAEESKILEIATKGFGIYVSLDGGASWTSSNKGLAAASIKDLAVDGRSLYAATWGDGLHLSRDGGGDWKAISRGLKCVYVNRVQMVGKNIFAATEGGGVFMSSDQGSSWAARNSGLTNFYVGALLRCGENLLAFTDDGLWVSSDRGGRWNAADWGIPKSSPITCIDRGGKTIFFGVWDYKPNGFGGKAGVFFREDNGNSGEIADSGLPADLPIQCIAAAGKSLLAGTRKGLFLYNDKLKHWAGSDSGLPADANVQCFAINGSRIFAGTWGGGVFFSADNGITWKAINTGLLRTYISCLALNNSHLFAGTEGSGVWRLPLADITNEKW